MCCSKTYRWNSDFLSMLNVIKGWLEISCMCQRKRKEVQQGNKCKYLNQTTLFHTNNSSICWHRNPVKRNLSGDNTNCSPVFQHLKQCLEAGPHQGSISKRWHFTSVYLRKKQNIPKTSTLQIFSYKLDIRWKFFFSLYKSEWERAHPTSW